MMRLHKNRIVFLLVGIFLCQRLGAFPFFSKKESDDPKKVLEERVSLLQKKQINQPHDPLVNYNVGVALYRSQKFDQATKNFERVLQAKSKDQELLKKAYFNLGNSYYQNVRSQLGRDWEKKDIDSKKLDNAITEVKASIEKYKNFLVIDQESERGKKNLAISEALLKKLEEKKQQQQQKNDQQKDQQGNDDKQKDHNKNQNKSDQQGKDQQQKDKQQNDQSNSDQQKQDDKSEQNEKNKQNQEHDQKQQQDQKQQGQKSDQHDQKQQQGNQEQKQADDKKDNDQKRKQDDQKSESDDDRSKEEKRQQEVQGSQGESGSDQEKEQEGHAVDQAAQQPDEGMERRGMKAILDNLQEDESKLQKALIHQNIKGQQPEGRAGQKPW